MLADSNYLIISDLHVRGGFSDRTYGLYHFDEEFADFLRYYRLHRASTRPWTLIINGDFIEFHYVTDLPDPDHPLLHEATFSERERVYGAGRDAQKSRWKLDRILRSCHPQLLLALARFVAEGNHIVILSGNHDSELFWPDVQEHFRRLIAEHHPADIGYLAMKEAVTHRVHFSPWCWYVPDVLWVEHGCQYDQFCSFRYVLNPVVPAQPALIESSISDLSIRYFANQVKLLDAMAVENITSTTEYIGWVLRGHRDVLTRAAKLYAGMVRNVLAKSGRPHRNAEADVRAEHARRAAANDARFGLPEGTSAAVQALHAIPVMRRPYRTLRFLGVDLLAAGVVLLALVPYVMLAYPGGAATVRVGLIVTALAALVYEGRRRSRRIFDYRHLSRLGGRIAARVGVPHVIFGHSHQAGARPLPNGGTYFNVGTWVPLSKQGYFVYLAITADGPERTAGLWRWNKARREPEQFDG